MKKLAVALMSVCVLASSCDKNLKIDESNGPSIVNPGDIIVENGEALKADTQKEKLEQVASKLMNEFDVKEYENLIEVSEVMFRHADKYYYDEDYDWSALEDPFEDIAESLYDESNVGKNRWECTLTLFLSNCTGEVTLSKHEATYKESKKTKVVLKDVDGEDWEFEVTSKNLKEVYLGEYLDTYYNYDTGKDATDAYYVSVEIPNSLTFSVTKGGKFFAEATVRFDYSISEDGLDIERDRIGVEVDLTIDDLTMLLKKASYDAATDKLEYSYAFKKGEVFILSQSVKASAKVDVDEDDDYYVEDWDASVDVEMNILGEVQVKGTCTDANKLASYLDAYYETEKDCERAVNNANALIDLGVYYDCTDVKQASIEFDVVVDEDYYGYEDFWIEPVIVFEDGSSYLFYEYFDDRIFEVLAEDFEDFIFDYEEEFEDIY